MSNLLRVYVVILLLGWGLWLALDKPAPTQAGPMPPAPSPYALPMPERPTTNPIPLAPPEGDWLADLQYGMDLLKLGETRQAYLVTWRRQYWMLSAAAALLLVALLPPLVSWFRHRRGSDTKAASAANDAQ